MSNLTNNTTELQKILDAVNGLPEAGSAVTAESIQAALGYAPADQAEVDEISAAVFETEFTFSANVFNPNTTTQKVVANVDYLISDVIPCSIGDVVYVKYLKDDNTLGLAMYGLWLVATNGTEVFVSGGRMGGYTVAGHASIPELLGVKIGARNTDIPFEEAADRYMVTINTEPTTFEAWGGVSTVEVSLVAKNRAELQAQIDALKEQETGNAVQYVVQSLTEEQKAQARANIGAAAAPVLTDEELLMSADGLTLTHDDGLIHLGQWVTSSTNEPFMNSSGEKMCTRKIKTTKLPQRVSGPVPWQYTFWKDGVNLGVQLAYADAQTAGFVTDLDFDEVAINWGYGSTGGVMVVLMLPTQSSAGFSKVLVMGDSISTDYYGSYTKWVTMLMDDGFFPATNTTNDSIHATGFVARYNNEANDFLTRIEAITDKSSYDLVIVFGGINDFIQAIPLGGGDGETDTATYFKPAVDYFFDYLVNNFTQARIVVLSPLRTYHPYPNTSGFAQSEYTAYIREKAKSYCLPVLNLSEESGFIPFNDTFKNMWTFTGWAGGDGTKGDGVHPSEEYIRKFLAPMIKGFLMGIKPS